VLSTSGKKTLRLLDSLGGSKGEKFEKFVLGYLRDEHKDKKNNDLPELDLWRLVEDEPPQQTNGSDCGVFICQFAECISDGRPFDFGQSDIPDRRLKMAAQIVRGEF